MKRLILIALPLALLSSPTWSQDSDWTIGSRTLPAPAGVSDALRAAIASTPQPDVVQHMRQTTYTTREIETPTLILDYAPFGDRANWYISDESGDRIAWRFFLV